VVDPSNRVRTANQSARALLGLDPDDALMQLPRTLQEHLAAWRQETELRVAPFQVGPDTPEIRVNFFPVRPDDPQGEITIFVEDTSEIQQQAQQLKLAALGRLSASIAHEIRNPLGAISHAAQLLGESPNLDQGDRRLTGIIHNHCQRMNGVIENVLEMSRRRLPSPVRLDLKDYLQAFARSYRETAGTVCLEVAVADPDAAVRMDRTQLDQVLTNLVANAARHSCAHSGTPYARIEAAVDPRTERPYVNVIDRGPGIQEADAEKLFEPFYTTEPSGTGLGLYIARELCEANQARLSWQAHTDGGSCFRITFAHPDRIFAGSN
jgi:two-component system sensor histidine kinase PilS (NtrC family)